MNTPVRIGVIGTHTTCETRLLYRSEREQRTENNNGPRACRPCQQCAVVGVIASLSEIIGDGEQRLATIERVLFALARPQGIDPATVG